MVGAILSVILGASSLIVAVPVVLPVVSLALGLNAVIKERRRQPRSVAMRRWATSGAAISGISVALMIIGMYVRAR